MARILPWRVASAGLIVYWIALLKRRRCYHHLLGHRRGLHCFRLYAASIGESAGPVCAWCNVVVLQVVSICTTDFASMLGQASSLRTRRRGDPLGIATKVITG